MKSGAMQPHFQRQDYRIRHVENTRIPAPSGERGPAFTEVVPGPAPAFSFASLARYLELHEVLNRVAGTVLLLAAAPLLLLVAIIVHLSSSGPILHRELRVGNNRRGVPRDPRDSDNARWRTWARFLAIYDDARVRDRGGAPFTLYKFRTQCDAAQSSTDSRWAGMSDSHPSHAAIGHFLRKSRLDVLPMLINVIRGEIRIVGPHPWQSLGGAATSAAPIADSKAR